ncbi:MULTISPECIES: exodeoxyribonuclease VII large subunit [Rhodanobacter]|uniref:exodeoxyribonuclease VII large subunit n=1 Tax=Rhodanobacter TaxID=75309 RepID=UPI0003F89F8C|nr:MULTISPECIES: exodeoxyribonuclease VII large subunit [Rhodanobacter]KZC18683.1 exodeoxyribonuclease VII large subunit [Rhodanobacter denitrificans]UJJ49494.1 exodeoxyribonuclease VII large subunit [Rhodanobacter denitrificans]UJM92208.1 exodeoxyribonuclease VII large subunit [Rhodanobacter denitrificans]UJM95737.1 exodeoxyribonuclease VII large subunit [Rhodanobacter denitrificans]UJN21432.1 exodeoxyribonuclease VII large subunit [Rhodanobacter denitrificans]
MSAPFDDTTPRHVLTPSSLNRLVRDLLGDALPLVWIEGELSNVAKPASGHLYFTLKDSGAQVRCAMFRMKASALRFRPVDGMQVLLRARVGLYEPRGEFQLVAEYMEPAGEGALQREFEQLKARLDAEGLFDPARKRALPVYARRIGVITSATGAAVRDVLSVLGRRWPLAEVEVLPVPVQGREAPPAIVAMLRKTSASARYDVLLLTRGGGSLEDLWAFNEEAVARAIHASAVPVVSAVGHEIDFSIADFVADLRAPTPSAAAELLVPDAVAVDRHLRQLQQRLATLLQRRLQAQSQRVDHLLARLQAQRPQARLQRDRERLQHLRLRLASVLREAQHQRRARLDRLHARLLAQHPRTRLPLLTRRLNEQQLRLHRAIAQILERRQTTLRHAGHALHAVSPLATLERGYAILFDADGQVLRSVQGVEPGNALRARLVDGELGLRVEECRPAKSRG